MARTFQGGEAQAHAVAWAALERAATESTDPAVLAARRELGDLTERSPEAQIALTHIVPSFKTARRAVNVSGR